MYIISTYYLTIFPLYYNAEPDPVPEQAPVPEAAPEQTKSGGRSRPCKFIV